MNHNDAHVFLLQIMIQGGIIFFWCLCLLALSLIYLPHKRRWLVQARLVIAHIVAVALEYGLAVITVIFPRKDLTWSALFLCVIVFLLVASATSYMVFLRRLKRTFQSSFCAISPRLYFVHIILLTCCVALQCAGMLLSIFYSLPTLTMLCMLSSFLLLAFGVVHIVAVFNANLFKVMRLEQRHKPKNLECDPQIVEVATKQTLLSTLPVIVTLVTFPTAALAMPLFGAFACYISTFWALGLVVMMTALSHLLSFGEFDGLYSRCCHLNHLCVQRCCHRIVQHQIRNVVSKCSDLRRVLRLLNQPVIKLLLSPLCSLTLYRMNVLESIEYDIGHVDRSSGHLLGLSVFLHVGVIFIFVNVCLLDLPDCVRYTIITFFFVDAAFPFSVCISSVFICMWGVLMDVNV